MSSTDDQVLVEASDHTALAIEAMIAAVDISAAGGQDFAEWLSQVLATTAAVKGSLIAGRPGSWESAYVQDFLGSTVGLDDEQLSDYLPEGFRPPVSGAALYESEDGTLWLGLLLWDDLPGRPGQVYERVAPLMPTEDIYTDAEKWLTEQIEPSADGKWALVPDVTEVTHRLVGTLRKESTGVWFDAAPDLDERPLPVRRYCQTDSALKLEDQEAVAQDEALADLAVLAGELPAEDRAGGVLYGMSPEERNAVTLLYATALGLARDDQAAFDRACEIKASYDEWCRRWHTPYLAAARNNGGLGA